MGGCVFWVVENYFLACFRAGHGLLRVWRERMQWMLKDSGSHEAANPSQAAKAMPATRRGHNHYPTFLLPRAGGRWQRDWPVPPATSLWLWSVAGPIVWFEFFSFLFGWFLLCSLMLRAPLLNFLVWFCFVRVGLVWFCFACFSDFFTVRFSWLYLSAC